MVVNYKMDLVRNVITYGVTKFEDTFYHTTRVQHIEIDELISGQSPTPNSSRRPRRSQHYFDFGDGVVNNSQFQMRQRTSSTAPAANVGNFQKSTQKTQIQDEQEVLSSSSDHNFPAASASSANGFSSSSRISITAGDLLLQSTPTKSWVRAWKSHSERFYEEMNYFIRPKLTDLSEQSQWENEDKIRRVALTSRLILLIIQILSASLIPRHENDGFETPRDNLGENATALDRLVNVGFAGFVNWDGEYFLHITTNGYTHENTIAFFPLFPGIVSFLATILHAILFGIISFQSTALIISWGVNTYCFTESAVDLLKLVKYFDNGLYCLDDFVLFLFCYNPASIFFSSYYSESMFAYATINVLLALHEKNLLKSIQFAAYSTVCRSNGLLNFGFIAAYVLKNLLALEPRYHAHWYQKFLIVRHYAWILMQCALGLVPFALFQVYCSWKFCGKDGGQAPGEALKLCDLQVLPYMYIQSKNWNVGFLRYFELTQLPNFLLAAPVLAVLGFEAYKRSYFYGQCVLQLQKWDLLLDLAMGVHGLFLTVFCLFFIHVQVSTRMILSSCPYLYIYIAKSLRTEICRLRSREINWLTYTFIIHTWCCSYFIVGTLLFSRGYPWT